MKVLNIESLKNHVCDLLGSTVNVMVGVPKIPTQFVVIPGSVANLKGPLGELIRKAWDEDVWGVPTPAGNGIIVDLKDWFDGWEVWGYSENGKFLLYKVGEFHIFTMEELGEYICEISGCSCVAYAPTSGKLSFEVIADGKYDTELGGVLENIKAQTCGVNADCVPEVLDSLKKKAHQLIWGDKDVFVCPSEDGPKFYVFGKQFQNFLDNFHEMSDAISIQCAGHPMEGAVNQCMDDLAALVDGQDIGRLGEDIEEVIELLRDIIDDGPAGKAISAMADMFVD